MFDKNLHRDIMGEVLKAFYSDPEIGPYLGFKGGTAAYFFYNLPRMSVDLDFDLLDEDKKAAVFEAVKKVVPRFGEIMEATEKRYTLFFLIRYKFGARNLKIEISKRKPIKKYLVKSFLGLPVLVGEKDGALSGKLSAFLTRKVFASRDAFDLWYFLKEKWEIDVEDLKLQTGLSPKEALNKALDKTLKINKAVMLKGLGELVEENQKSFIKEKLLKDLEFYLRLYLEKYS